MLLKVSSIVFLKTDILILVNPYNLSKQVCPEQIQVLLYAFKHVNETMQKGLNFRDKLYTCVRADKHSIYAKCVSKKNYIYTLLHTHI